MLQFSFYNFSSYLLNFAWNDSKVIILEHKRFELAYIGEAFFNTHGYSFLNLLVSWVHVKCIVA